MATLEAEKSDGPTTWRPGPLPSDPSLVALSLGACGSRVVIDLTTYAPHDTSDLGALVLGVRQFYTEGGRPVVVCPEPGTRLLLESTGIDRLVPVVRDLEQAQARFDHPTSNR